MLRIRLKRLGRRNRPFYRIAAMDQRTRRNGRTVEELGYYDPLEKDQEKALKVDTERARYWLSVGAQPTQTVRDLFRKAGVDAKPGTPVQ